MLGGIESKHISILEDSDFEDFARQTGALCEADNTEDGLDLLQVYTLKRVRR